MLRGSSRATKLLDTRRFVCGRVGSNLYFPRRATLHSPGGIVSRSLNKVTLIGNLGNDPEVRSTTGGNRVATFSLATSRTWNDPSGQRQEKTEWHRCVVWNTKTSQLADIVERYVKKGDKLFVEGRIEYRQWQDQQGQTRYSTEINVRELIMLTSRQGGGDG